MENKTVKVVADWLESGFMIVDAADFDPEKHEVFDGEIEAAPKKPKPLTIDEAKAALDEAGVEYNKNLGVKALRKMVAELGSDAGE